VEGGRGHGAAKGWQIESKICELFQGGHLNGMLLLLVGVCTDKMTRA